MNVELHIKVNGYTEELDLYPDETIEYISKGLDFLKFDRQYAPFTKKFNVPATPKNHRLLKYWGELDIQNSYNPHKAVLCYLVIADVLTFFGSLEISGVVHEQGNITQYKVGFFGSAFNVKNIISDDALTDLNWSTDDKPNGYTNFAFDLNNANVKASWDFNLNSGDVYVPIMGHEHDYCYIPEINSKNIPCNIASDAPVIIDDDGETVSYSVGVRVDEQKPAYLLRSFVENIFANYQIKVAEWGTEITAFLHNLYIMPSREAGKMVDDEYLSSQLVIVNNDINTGQSIGGAYVLTDYTIEQQDSLNQFDLTTDRFTSVATGWHTFRYNFDNIDKPGGTGVLNMQARDQSGNTYDHSDFYEIGSFNVTVWLNAGEWIEFWVNQDSGTNYNYYFYLSLVQFPNTIYDQTINPIITMPDIGAWDFLAGFFDTYNLLLLLTGVDGEIRIISKAEYYREGKSIDVTQYIDYSKQTFSKVPVDETIGLNHQPGEDKQNAAFRQTALRDFGNLLYHADVDFSNAEFDVESPFTIFPPAYMVQWDSDGLPERVTNLLLHSMFDLSGDKVQSDFLMFYAHGSRDSDTYYLQNGTDVLTGLPTYEPTSTWGYYSQNTDYPSLTLSKTSCYTPESPPSGNVAGATVSRDFFLDYFALLYANGAKLARFTGFIPVEKFKNIFLNDRLIINDISYLINEIKYNWTTQELKLDLLKYDSSFEVIYPTEYADTGDIYFNGTPKHPDLLTWAARSKTSTPGDYWWTYWRRQLSLVDIAPQGVTTGLLAAATDKGAGAASGGAIIGYSFTIAEQRTNLMTLIEGGKYVDVTLAPDNFLVYENGVFNLSFSFETDVENKDVIFFVTVYVDATPVYYYSYAAPKQKIVTVGFSTAVVADAGQNVYCQVATDADNLLDIISSRWTITRQ